MQQTNLIVGGGIAGLLAAILMKQKDPKTPTMVIEQSDECGGLLRSIKKDTRHEFDYGSHIVAQTGLKELDDILFERVNLDEWYEMPLLKSAGYFNGQLEHKSHFPNLGFLSEGDCQRATYELLECASHPKQDAANLEEHLTQTYGEYLTETYYRVIMKRQLGVDLKDLHSFANCLFGYVRFIVGDTHLARMLKTIPALNETVAFRSYEEGVSSLMNYYPKQGRGIGKWVEDMVAQARDLGVEVLTGTALTDCQIKNKTIERATLSDGRTLQINEMIWTVAPFLFFKASGLAFESRYKPKLRKMQLFHYVIDQPFLTDAYHVYCTDASLRSFRITLYPNLQNDNKPNGDYRCTVEVMVQDDEKYEDLITPIWDELKTMGLISKDTQALHAFGEDLANGFPIMTNEFVAEMQRQHDLISREIKNIRLLGKGSTKSFFMNDVLKEVYTTLCAEDYMMSESA